MSHTQNKIIFLWWKLSWNADRPDIFDHVFGDILLNFDLIFRS